jgi:hypothetical protein
LETINLCVLRIAWEFSPAGEILQELEEHEDRAGYGKIFSSFVLFVCSVVISIFVLVAA